MDGACSRNGFGDETCGKEITWKTETYVVGQKISRTHRGKIATHLIAEYHRVRLQNTPLGKLRNNASA